MTVPDWGASGRRDEYSLHLVDPFSLQETGETVDFVDGEGSITWSRDAENAYTAKLYLANATNKDRMIRVKHSIFLPDGYQHGETLGTFFVDGSTADAIYGSVKRSVDCYSPLYRFTQDTLARDFVRYAGQVIVDEVRDLVETDGGKLKILPGVDESRQHTIDIWFEVGKNRAEVLNQIASWTACEMGVDEDGYITWGPYEEPETKAVSYVFEAGANCAYKPGFSLSDTSMDSVNRVVAHYSRQSKQDDDLFPLSDSVYVDLPEDNAYSYERIGRRKTYDMSVSEPCSHEELTAQAERYLWEHSGSYEYYEIEHVGIPGLRVGQKVRYVNDMDASVLVDDEFIVEEISMDLKPGATCKTKLRRL